MHLLQVYEDGETLAVAASIMEQERRFIRSQPGGSDIVVQAARLGKEANPKISLIFDDVKEAAYVIARNSA